MIRITALHLQIHHTKEQLYQKAAKELGVKVKEIQTLQIARKSLDARKKTELKFTYTLDITLMDIKQEERILQQNIKNIKIKSHQPIIYTLPSCGNEKLQYRPIVVGFGPAGMFSALSLARAGFCPIVLERGEDVDTRSKTVEDFWKKGILNPESNVSFGEGGAGTFSDGKLNTMVKDTNGRNREVMQTFIKHGADEEILYDYKPHIGTDRLKEVVRGIREEIITLGGEIRFGACLKEMVLEEFLSEEIKEREQIQKRVRALRVVQGQKEYILKTQVLILAIGHSARDTFQMLYAKKVPMKAKPFAVGLRIQHPQEMIDISQYGEKEAKFLSPAPYKLTAKSKSGRGVYSFCMCPGGYVVAASTQEKTMVVNGMSYHNRDSAVSNSAIIVTVEPKDFGIGHIDGEDNVLAGIYFQKELEERAFFYGKGKIPIQLYGDYKRGRLSEGYGGFLPCFKGQTHFARVDKILPKELKQAILEAMPEFEKKIKGFSREDSILAGVESRTSSPIKIERDDKMESLIKGLYPSGEGAGYAGGITSAAMDGLKVAESIIAKFNPIYLNKKTNRISDIK